MKYVKKLAILYYVLPIIPVEFLLILLCHSVSISITFYWPTNALNCIILKS